MNTSHVELCLKTLENAAEYPSDVFLIKLVKSQQIAQNIALTMSFDPTQQLPLPIPVMVQTFQEQIKNFRETLPKHLQDDGEPLLLLTCPRSLFADTRQQHR